MSSRSKHQFRPDRLELFEERITPSTVQVTNPPFPVPPPFVPPGQNTGFSPAPGSFTTSISHSDESDTVIFTITNNTGSAQDGTFALYTAPGGGENPNSHAYDNLLSQNLIESSVQTFHLAASGPGATATVTVQANLLPLTGQQKWQQEWFLGNNYAPKKPTEAALNNHIIIGTLWDTDNSGGTPTVHGPGR